MVDLQDGGHYGKLARHQPRMEENEDSEEDSGEDVRRRAIPYSEHTEEEIVELYDIWMQRNVIYWILSWMIQFQIIWKLKLNVFAIRWNVKTVHSFYLVMRLILMEKHFADPTYVILSWTQ